MNICFNNEGTGPNDYCNLSFVHTVVVTSYTGLYRTYVTQHNLIHPQTTVLKTVHAITCRCCVRFVCGQHQLASEPY